MELIVLELEIDPRQAGVSGGDLIEVDSPGLASSGVRISVEEFEEGHGFGVSELVTIAVAVAGGVASDLVASSIKQATKGVIRRVRTRRRRSDGSLEGMSELLDDERADPPEETADEDGKTQA